MSYRTLPWTAGFLPVFPEARGANVAAMFLTLLSAALGPPADDALSADTAGLAASAVPAH